MTRKRVLVTGATSGIGRATALALAREGAQLALLSRNGEAGQSLARSIVRSGTGARARFFPVDLGCFEQVRAAARAIAAEWDSLDVLINNAGARLDVHATNPQGIEFTFAANHLGHFLLTALLLDRLLAANAARVITVASSVHRLAQPDWRSHAKPVRYDRKQAYAGSKLANVVFSHELARRLQGTSVVANAFDPGIVATHFGHNNGLLPWLKHLVYHGLKRELVSARRAAQRLVFVATQPSLQTTTGAYFCGRQTVPSAPPSQDPAIAADLWALSVEMTGLDPSIGSAWRWMQP